MTLKVYTEFIEISFLEGNYSQQKKISNIVLDNAQELIDKVIIYNLEIQAYSSQHKFYETIKTAKDILSILGIKLPKKPSNFDILVELLKTKFKLVGKTTDDLFELSVMTDEYKLATVRNLMRMNV